MGTEVCVSSWHQVSLARLSSSLHGSCSVHTVLLPARDSELAWNINSRLQYIGWASALPAAHRLVPCLGKGS